MFTREQFDGLTFEQKKEVMEWRSKFHQKKAKATAEAKRVKKNGVNTYHNYAYATESDVKEEMTPILFECGLSYSVDLISRKESEPRKTNNGYAITTDVTMKFTFTDVETGYFEEFNHDGTAMDSGDKGIYKAYSNTIKYALMDYFLISTGDDVEREGIEIDPGKPQQQKPQKQQKPPQNGGGGQAIVTVKQIMDAEDRACLAAGRDKPEIRKKLKEVLGMNIPQYKEVVANDPELARSIVNQLDSWTNYYISQGRN